MALVRLYGARDTMEAEFIRDLIAEQGIDATVMGGTLGAARGDLPMTVETLPGVYVREQDAARGLEVVREFQRRAQEVESNPPAEWSCPECGEKNESQFTQCWKCQTDRPSPV